LIKSLQLLLRYHIISNHRRIDSTSVIPMGSMVCRLQQKRLLQMISVELGEMALRIQAGNCTTPNLVDMSQLMTIAVDLYGMINILVGQLSCIDHHSKMDPRNPLPPSKLTALEARMVDMAVVAPLPMLAEEVELLRDE
jgi:hypothetical protein